MGAAAENVTNGHAKQDFSASPAFLLSTVSSMELSQFFGPLRVPGRELSEFLSAHYMCAK